MSTSREELRAKVARLEELNARLLKHDGDAKAICDGYALEHQQFSDELEVLRAEVARLKKPFPSGIAMASELAPEHAKVIASMKEQLLICFLKRLGGTVVMPVTEVDDTAQDLFAFRIDFEKKEFNFHLQKKQ